VAAVCIAANTGASKDRSAGPIVCCVGCPDQVAGYSFDKSVRGREGVSLYVGTRISDRAPVLIKLYSPEVSREGAAIREVEALRSCAHERVPGVLEFRQDTDRHVVVLQREKALTLSSWANSSRRPPPAAVLSIGIQVADLLAHVHTLGYVHGNVTPRSILVGDDTSSVWLTDFELATREGSHSADIATQRDAIAPVLAYLPPEQIGLVERPCDHRSDLYSLGASLYRALTGRRPFSERSHTHLLQALLSELPAEPHEVHAEVPKAFSRAIMKLLSKDPGERYQSATALASDLRDLRAEWERNLELDFDFVLGRHEAPARPVFPAGLYGRDAEMASALTFCSSPTADRPRLLLVRGEPGTGKSAFLDALRDALSREGMHVGSGHFRAHLGQAYTGLADALGSLTTLILLGSDASLEAWRSELAEALSSSAAVLTDLVPDLEAVLGGVGLPSQIRSRNAQARLALAIERFLTPFTCSGRRLALLFDDLDTSDIGSRTILEGLLTSSALGALTVVATISCPRDVEPGGELAPFIENLERNGSASGCLDLGSLSDAAALRLLADTLRCPDAELSVLAQRIAQATDNAPLLIREFILHLHARGCLEYREGAWCFDPDQLHALPAPDGAAALMAEKLERLAPAQQRLLEIAGCMSRELEPELLAEIAESGLSETQALLSQLAADGYLIPGSRGFRFAHARIREAAAGRVDATERARMSCRIGESLLARTPDDQRELRAIDIVEHLNAGATVLPEALKRPALELNLQAGRQLLYVGAGADAEKYFRAADTHLSPELWQTERALAFDVHLDWVESLLQSQQQDRALELLDALSQRCPSREESLRIGIGKLRAYTLYGSFPHSARYALELLASVGIRWPLYPSRLRVYLSLSGASWWIRRRAPADLFNPEVSLSPDRIERLTVLRAAAGILTRFDPMLGVLGASYMVRDLMRYGTIADPSMPLAGVAYFAWRVTGNYRLTTRYIEAARYWLTRAQPSEMSIRAEMQLDGLLMAWLGSRRATVSTLESAQLRLLERGDSEYAIYARFNRALILALSGGQVDSTARELYALGYAFERSAPQMSGVGRLARAYAYLQGPELDRAAMLRDASEDDVFLRRSESSAESYLRCVWMMVFYVFAEFERAYAQLEEIGGHLKRLVFGSHSVDIHFYGALAAAELARSVRGWRRLRYVRSVARARTALRQAAEFGPDFIAMRLLVEAEYASLRGRSTSAARLRADAATRASQQGFLNLSALALERRARTLDEHGRVSGARSYLMQAQTYYARWGALAKASLLSAELNEGSDIDNSE